MSHRQSEVLKALWKDPEWRARTLAARALSRKSSVEFEAIAALKSEIDELRQERDAARALIRSLIERQRGYKPGCRCNGCREIAAALGEKIE